MPDIFNNQPGVVVALKTDEGTPNPFRVAVDGFAIDGSQFGVIVTELAIQLHGNYQFLHTLKDLIYVYSFGPRIGQIRLNGIAFAQLCGGTLGLKQVIGYYEANCLDNRATPISLTIGTDTSGRFRGFLTELNFDVTRPESQLAQFGWQFHALPAINPGP
jgi:hypothetical protein